MKTIRFSLFAILIILIGLTATTAFGKSFVTDGLISFWTFDKSDIKDKIVKDMVGKNDGNIKGAPVTVQGKIEEALSFDGAKDLVEVPINDELSRIDTDSMTVEAWLNVEKPAYGVICGRDYWILHWSTEGTLPTKMTFYVDVGGWKSVTSNASTKGGEWHHWAGVYDGKQLKVYFDGKMDASNALSGKIVGTGDGHSKYIVFGKDYHTDVGQSRWNKVVIDEVRIYKRALTDAEILQNFETDANSLSVKPVGKLAVTWGDIKR